MATALQLTHLASLSTDEAGINFMHSSRVKYFTAPERQTLNSSSVIPVVDPENSMGDDNNREPTQAYSN
jgi:hypothetical protein